MVAENNLKGSVNTVDEPNGPLYASAEVVPVQVNEVTETEGEEAKSGPNDKNLLQRSQNEFKAEISKGPEKSTSPKF